MIWVVYEINVATKTSKYVGLLKKHTDMNIWIKTNGYKEHV